jgi:hypothetical protein
MIARVARNVTSISLLACALCFGWGPTGHRASARIAEKHLSKKAASKVAELIGPESLPEVSTWADDVRSDSAWRRSAFWHYVDIDDGESYASSRKNPAGDIITELQACEATLRNPRAGHEAKVVALKFLVHLVADLHQPLHVGRASDRGGNNVRVSWFGKSTNLHEVWDSLLIDKEKLSFSELAEFSDHATRQRITSWQESGYLDWLEESLLLRKQAYEVGNGKLSSHYASRNFPVVKLRLAQSGIRLAGLLNSIFD